METIITIWLWGIIPICAFSAWLNRYMPAPDNAIFMCAIWPVVLLFAAFHVAFSGFAPFRHTRP